MTIPRVKTALGASDTAMPAMPAPQAAYWSEGDSNFYFANLPISGDPAFQYVIKPECTILQLAPGTDAVMIFDSPELIAFGIGFPLKAGGFYTFSVTPGSTMYIAGTTSSFGTLFVLEG